jgi:hypothetical protein
MRTTYEENWTADVVNGKVVLVRRVQCVICCKRLRAQCAVCLGTGIRKVDHELTDANVVELIDALDVARRMTRR